MPSRVRRRALALVFVALLGLVLAHVALAGDPAGLSPRGPDSPQAAKIEDIYWVLIAITGAIFVLVEGALILFIIRFRNRGRSRTAEGPEIHGATRLELIWTAIPVVILAAIAAFVLVKLPGINSGSDSAKAAGPPLIVKVEGRQYYWNFIYPNGVIQVERMRVPEHRNVKLIINSGDVDHSWWIPALQGKFDAIPGKTNHLWFTADRTGTFEGQCGELRLRAPAHGRHRPGHFGQPVPKLVRQGSCGPGERHLRSREDDLRRRVRHLPRIPRPGSVRPRPAGQPAPDAAGCDEDLAGQRTQQDAGGRQRLERPAAEGLNGLRQALRRSHQWRLT